MNLNLIFTIIFAIIAVVGVLCLEPEPIFKKTNKF